MSNTDTQLSDPQKKVVLAVLEAYNDQITYVIPRGHQSLPDSVPGADLDVLVNADEFNQATEIAHSIGFKTKEKGSSSRLSLFTDALKEPEKAVHLAINEPREIKKVLFTGERTSITVNPKFEQNKLMFNGLQLHLMNHIAYKSPLNEKPVRVDPRVEEYMFEDRIQNTSYYIPDEPDELAHLLCRGIFDYKGEFPKYYKTRCASLFESVSNDVRKDEKFRELLELLFFGAGDVVYQKSSDREFDTIREELLQFEKY